MKKRVNCMFIFFMHLYCCFISREMCVSCVYKCPLEDKDTCLIAP